ncbi:hypothetical protein Hanom_Chr03g00179361 [Helianthus anomalus]
MFKISDVLKPKWITTFQNTRASQQTGQRQKKWSFSDPELQRKKRVASYKAYTMEGKVKGSIKKSLRWVTDKYLKIMT